MKAKRKKFKDPDLDLVPIMNLVTILIPFLIMAAEFIQLAVIDSSAPPIGKPPPETDQQEEPFQLIVMIMDNGLYIKGSGPVMQLVYGDAAGAGGDDEGELEPTYRCTDGQAMCSPSSTSEPPSFPCWPMSRPLPVCLGPSRV